VISGAREDMNGIFGFVTVLAGPLVSTIFQVRLKQDTETPESE
jgi:hypothetical protein